jgi:pyrroline-5-carboxylate reductase
MKIAFVGGGNMGEAMIRGILDKGLAGTADISVSDVSPSRRSFLAQQYGVSSLSGNCAAAERAEAVVLAVKPVALPEVMSELKACLQPGQTVISIAAGVSLAKLTRGLDRRSVVRAMPNTPAQIGEGMTVWTATPDVTELDKSRAGQILGAIGRQVFVSDEKYVDMATAVSGSGPAYVFLVIESLTDAAVRIGLPRDLAQQLVLETVAGSTHLAQKSARHPAELRNLVTSPGGTTAEGLHQLEEGSLRALLARAIVAGYEKAKELRGD